MYSYVFPDLDNWFTSNAYVEHNSCEMLEINMKAGLTKSEITEFCKVFAKYICSIRCSSKKLYDHMVDAIENGTELSPDDKQRLHNDFWNGFITESLYKTTRDYKKSFDDEGIKGYLGEALYYLIRNQYAKDLKITIEPGKPKAVSKTSGIDFLEVRKDDKGEYYFIIGEVKTSENSYSSRNDEVIKAFLNRINKNFSDIYFCLKERDDETDITYTQFLEDMTDYFYSFSGNNKKRLSGVFNYNYLGKKIPASAFSTWKDKEFEINDSPMCRKIKLIGIYNIEAVINEVRDILWNVL